MNRDVELKRMHELVTDHVIRICDWSRERQYDPSPHWFGYAARSFAELSLNRIRLLEVRVRCVQDQRLTPPKLMGEHALETREPSFR